MEWLATQFGFETTEQFKEAVKGALGAPCLAQRDNRRTAIQVSDELLRIIKLQKNHLETQILRKNGDIIRAQARLKEDRRAQKSGEILQIDRQDITQHNRDARSLAEQKNLLEQLETYVQYQFRVLHKTAEERLEHNKMLEIINSMENNENLRESSRRMLAVMDAASVITEKYDDIALSDEDDEDDTTDDQFEVVELQDPTPIQSKIPRSHLSISKLPDPSSSQIHEDSMDSSTRTSTTATNVTIQPTSVDVITTPSAKPITRTIFDIDPRTLGEDSIFTETVTTSNKENTEYTTFQHA